jgi:hypothetical protein
MSAIPGIDTSDYHTATGSTTSISGAVGSFLIYDKFPEQKQSFHEP